ncbi:MAG: pepX [Solirubrobacteraceae bacterium]|nr:pepX [Solirubrobacteraceae bacterium]
MRIRHAVFLPVALLALHVPAALAQDPTGTTNFDPNWYKAAGATWTQAEIDNGDVKLHADVLRPQGATDATKTPVIVSIGPYFNHSGQVGAAAPAEGTSYYPVGENGIGPSDRFADFVEGAHLMAKGYTYVMVDLRGFGASTGCPDWGGAGEQSDVKSAIEWAAKQKWSTGLVGTYGKSYDAETGLIANALHPAGLAATVTQEPVYDDYRYLYGDGMRRENALATPALYDAIATTPGPLADSPDYNENSLTTPDCTAQNFADQATNDDHTSDYWKQRDLISEVKGSTVPLFLTQGLTENNTAPDGTAQFLANHAGFERGWMGPWEHVRGNETCVDGDGSTGCSDYPVGRLKEGRHGWFDEVMRFYDLFLKDQQPSVQDPPFAIQTNDGKWRGEASWPPADATDYTTNLNKGTYNDDAQASGTGDDAAGAWTISPALDHEVDLSGSPTATVNVTTTGANENLVADVYDLDSTGVGPLVSRQGFLVRQAGANQAITLHMWSADWRFAPGHHIGVRVTDNNQEWWILAAPTGNDVTVNGGTIALPFLKFARPDTIEGDPGVQLKSYLASTEDASALLAGDTAPGFNVPPALVAPQPGDPGTPQAIAAANERAVQQAQQVQQTQQSGSSVKTQGASARKAGRLSVHIARGKSHRAVASGTAPAHAKVTVELIRNGHVTAVHHVRATAAGRFHTTFRKVRRGRYRVSASSKAGKATLHSRSKTLSIR